MTLAEPAPTTSVVMPCHNAAAWVRRGIDSVLGQTLGDLELILVDDGSTDETPAILDGLGDGRASVIHQPNRGVSAARNRGLAAARGAFVAFLDSDDTWEPTFLEEMASGLSARPDAALAYCGWQNLGLAGGRGEPFVPPDYEGPDKAARLVESCPWPIHAALTRREAIEAAGGFDSRFAVGEDFLLWLEIACHRPIVQVPKVLAYYHFHGGTQATGNRVRAALQSRQVQETFLRRHPEIRTRLGRAHIRDLTTGRVLDKAFEAYWARDLPTARALFRAAMARGYGSLGQWKYMLPALLPIAVHRRLIGWLGN